MSLTLKIFIVSICFAIFPQILFCQKSNTVAFPMEFVPHEESLQEVNAREQRLANAEADFQNNYEVARKNNKLKEWVENYLPKLNLEPKSAVYSAAEYMTELFELTQFSLEYHHPELNSILIEKLIKIHSGSYPIFMDQRKSDMATGRPGYPADLNTVHVVNTMLKAAICLKQFGQYSGVVKDSTESFLNRFVENKGTFKGSFKSTGYNKEVYLMDIGSNVLYLYKNEPDKYPVIKKTFETFWEGLTRCSYDGDNSPHYDAGSGIWVALNMALLNNRLEDLKIRDDFHRILTRMAKTVMNNGETAKWGKSMGRIFNHNAQLTNDAGEALPWTLKMGYKLFEDPFILYVARKYEDLRMNGPIPLWNTAKLRWYPLGINYTSIKNVVPPADAPLSFVTNRLTSKKYYNGMQLGRGDTCTVLVQDKMVLTTGHHPRAPYLLVDMSYTQSKGSGDHRIGIENLIFDGTHICTYLDRPGNGNQINRPLVCPSKYIFPIVDAKYGDVYPSKDYTEKMGYNPSTDQIIKSYSAQNIGKNFAYGKIEYRKFQYVGVSASREIVLLHNGITLVWDKISASDQFKGEFNAGVIYQVWPSIKAIDTDKRWVLQGNHLSILVGKELKKDGFSTLFYFPKIDSEINTSLQTDPQNQSSKLTKVFSAYKQLKPNSSVNILSMIIPIQNEALVNEFVKSIRASIKGEKANIIIPGEKEISVTFVSNGLPVCTEK